MTKVKVVKRLTTDQKQKIKRDVKQVGLSPAMVAKENNVSLATVYNIIGEDSAQKENKQLKRELKKKDQIISALKDIVVDMAREKNIKKRPRRLYQKMGT